MKILTDINTNMKGWASTFVEKNGAKPLTLWLVQLLAISILISFPTLLIALLLHPLYTDQPISYLWYCASLVSFATPHLLTGAFHMGVAVTEKLDLDYSTEVETEEPE